MRNTIKKRLQNGDTIVEVLIAIAVVSSVLGISYSIMNRNILIMRDNQERTEAVKYAQGQVEALKYKQKQPTGSQELTAQGTAGFCLSDTVDIIDLNGGAPNTSLTADDFTNYNTTHCVKDSLYYVGIRREGADGNYLYKVTVRWNRLGGGRLDQGRNEATMVYRLD